MSKRQFTVLLVMVLGLLMLSACNNSDDETGDTSVEDAGPKTVALVVDASADTPVELMRGIIEDPISQVLAERGYVNGENLTFNMYFIGDQTDESLDLSGNDIVIALAEGALQRILDAGIQQPIVFMAESSFVDKIQDQLDDENLAITGVVTPASTTKRFELMLEMAPDIDTVFVPYFPEREESLLMLETVQRVAQESDITVVTAEYTDVESVKAAFDPMPDNIDAIFVSSDETMTLYLDQVAQISLQKKVLLSVDNLPLPVPEVLMIYGTNLLDSIQTTGRLVGDILDGTDVQDLPFETVDPRLVVSLGAAEAIGLEIPDSILQQASVIMRDEVVVAETTDETGFCSTTMESMIGSYTACVTTSCNAIPNTQLATFSDRVEVDSCITEELKGICSREEFDLYIYDGEIELIASGCGFQGGTWIEPTE